MDKKSKHFFKKYFFSIKAKVAILCTVFILIAVTVSNSFLLSVSKKAITQNTEEIMKDMAAAYSKNVSETVSKISQTSNFLMGSAYNYVNSDDTKDTSSISELVSNYLSMNTTSEEVNIVDSNGKILYSSDSDLIGTDLSKETYFSDMKASGLSTESDVYISKTSGDACITFAIPLRSGAPAMTFGSTAGNNGSVPASSSNASSQEAAVSQAKADNTPSQAAAGTGSGSAADANAQTSAGSDSQAAADAGSQTGMPAMSDSTETAVTEFTGAITVSIKASEFSDALDGISIGDYKSGYAFILDSDGNFVVHPDETLVGTKADIKGINEIITKIQKGTAPECDIITYTYNGTVKYAGYHVDTDNNWSLFITADQSEVLSLLKSVSSKSLLISILLVAVLTLLAYFITGMITNSIKKINQLINKTAELDFTDDTSFAALSARNDETGEMSRAIEKMRGILKTMILHISEVSGKITQSSANLSEFSYSVNDHTSDNSATAQELSAGMQETAATTEQIYTNIESIGNSSNDINKRAGIGTELSNNLINRALELKSATINATEKTNKIYEEVKEKTTTAIEKSKAVEKINILTNTIKEIASQTSLLALNASIEAARAGDAGRGFSVVANEIGILADRSAKTVGSITDIVDEVYQAVQNMTESLKQSLEFLEKNVLQDYRIFNDTSEKYNSDAKTMNETMESIQNEISLLNTNMQNISDSIAEINTMVSEASKGINDVAEKNTEIVTLTTNTQTMANENAEYADDLKKIVDRFKLE